MNYYNEARAENSIRRKARFITFVVSFLLVSAAFFIFTDSGRDVLPDQVKEWFQLEIPKEQANTQENMALQDNISS